MENGKRNPGLENIVFLAKAIGVTPAELFREFTKTYLASVTKRR